MAKISDLKFDNKNFNKHTEYGMSLLEKSLREPRSLFVRAISSTIVGQFLDNAIFACIAFLGVLPGEAIWSMILGGTLFEVIYEVIFYPITKTAIHFTKKKIGDE